MLPPGMEPASWYDLKQYLKQAKVISPTFFFLLPVLASDKYD